jgi:hypothetical protein
MGSCPSKRNDAAPATASPLKALLSNFGVLKPYNLYELSNNIFNYNDAVLIKFS